MDMKRPNQVTISLGELTARGGEYQTVFRSSWDDKQDVDKAANSLNMSSAQFIRMVVIQAARKVLAEVA
jgi:uncharacterized protein (DUF1778 family)